MEAQRKRLLEAAVIADVEFRPNLNRSEKLKFLNSLSVFCVPTRAAEAFGLYVIEAMAAGVPVVEPPLGSFPELIAATGGGVLAASASPVDLAQKIETLLKDREAARKMGRTGKTAAFLSYSADGMVRKSLEFYREAIELKPIASKN